jgi:hypothetical protein
MPSGMVCTSHGTRQHWYTDWKAGRLVCLAGVEAGAVLRHLQSPVEPGRDSPCPLGPLLRAINGVVEKMTFQFRGLFWLAGGIVRLWEGDFLHWCHVFHHLNRLCPIAALRQAKTVH